MNEALESASSASATSSTDDVASELSSPRQELQQSFTTPPLLPPAHFVSTEEDFALVTPSLTPFSDQSERTGEAVGADHCSFLDQSLEQHEVDVSAVFSTVQTSFEQPIEQDCSTPATEASVEHPASQPFTHYVESKVKGDSHNDVEPVDELSRDEDLGVTLEFQETSLHPSKSPSLKRESQEQKEYTVANVKQENNGDSLSEHLLETAKEISQCFPSPTSIETAVVTHKSLNTSENVCNENHSFFSGSATPQESLQDNNLEYSPSETHATEMSKSSLETKQYRHVEVGETVDDQPQKLSPNIQEDGENPLPVEDLGKQEEEKDSTLTNKSLKSNDTSAPLRSASAEQKAPPAKEDIMRAIAQARSTLQTVHQRKRNSPRVGKLRLHKSASTDKPQRKQNIKSSGSKSARAMTKSDKSPNESKQATSTLQKSADDVISSTSFYSEESSLSTSAGAKDENRAAKLTKTGAVNGSETKASPATQSWRSSTHIHRSPSDVPSSASDKKSKLNRYGYLAQ